MQAMLHFVLAVINTRTTPPATAGPSLTPRSIVLSVLLGSHPPSMPVGRLLEFTSLFGISEGAARTSLSRMVTAGELQRRGGAYELTGRLLERQSQQDAGRVGPPTSWDGSWWVAVVTTDRRSVAERREFRSRALGARLGELRPDVWLRPANIDITRELDGIALTRGPLEVGDEHELVERLWNLDALAARAHGLTERLEQSMARLEVGGDAALPDTFVQLAAAQRFLRTEPQLPTTLTSSEESTVLRSSYDSAVSVFQARLAEFFATRRTTSR
jgi:phenylacetic acid degradation operon negative regulatory protein